MRSANSYPEKDCFFLRDFRENLVWLLIMNLSFLLAGPFTLYLSGLNTPNLAVRSEEMRIAMLQRIATVLQLDVFAPLLLLAIAFLAWRLFGFSCKRVSSDLYLSLPIPRPALFLKKFLVGVVNITLLFALYAAVLMPLLQGQGAGMDALLGDWSRSWLGFYLASLAGFSSLALAFALCGTAGDSFRFSLSTQVVLPLLSLLLLQYASGSLPALHPDFVGQNFRRFQDELFLPAPLLQPFLPAVSSRALLLRLLSFLVFTLLALLAFCRRPAERAENRLGTERYFPWIAALEILILALCGGFFWEGVLGHHGVGLFLPAFLLTAGLGAAAAYWSAGAQLKAQKKTLIITVLVLLLLFCAVDLGLELKGRQRTKLPLDELKSFSLQEQLLYRYRNRVQDLIITEENHAELFRDLKVLAGQSPLLPSRKGFLSPALPPSLPLNGFLSAETASGESYALPLSPEADTQLQNRLQKDPEIGWLTMDFPYSPFPDAFLESVRLRFRFRDPVFIEALQKKLEGRDDLRLVTDKAETLFCLELRGKSLQKFLEAYHQDLDEQRKMEEGKGMPEAASQALYRKLRAAGLGPEVDQNYLFDQDVELRFRPPLDQEPFRSLLRLSDTRDLDHRGIPAEPGLLIHAEGLSPERMPHLCAWLLDDIFPASKGGQS